MTKADIDQVVVLLSEIIEQDRDFEVVTDYDRAWRRDIDGPMAKLARQARAILVIGDDDGR